MASPLRDSTPIFHCDQNLLAIDFKCLKSLLFSSFFPCLVTILRHIYLALAASSPACPSNTISALFSLSFGSLQTSYFSNPIIPTVGERSSTQNTDAYNSQFSISAGPSSHSATFQKPQVISFYLSLPIYISSFFITPLK